MARSDPDAEQYVDMADDQRYFEDTIGLKNHVPYLDLKLIYGNPKNCVTLYSIVCNACNCTPCVYPCGLRAYKLGGQEPVQVHDTVGRS